MRAICFVLLGTLALGSSTGLSKTVVATYVWETQEKRKSTRWTLTEWLRIKERMKLMDLWLAMVSDPKKDKFSPELSVGYGDYQGDLSMRSSTMAPTLFADRSTRMGRVQFWFTNLVSASTGLKTPNVDLGLEYASYLDTTPLTGLQFNTGSQQLDLNNHEFDYKTVNFRIFGRNIQDTSLVLKYGQYTSNKGFDDSVGDLSPTVSGVVSGVESYFYFLSWLGLEGQYLKFGNENGAAGSEEISGVQQEYGVFLELFNFRAGYGFYEYDWSWKTNNYDVNLQEDGSMLSLKLQF